LGICTTHPIPRTRIRPIATWCNTCCNTHYATLVHTWGIHVTQPIPWPHIYSIATWCNTRCNTRCHTLQHTLQQTLGIRTTQPIPRPRICPIATRCNTLCNTHAATYCNTRCNTPWAYARRRPSQGPVFAPTKACWFCLTTSIGFQISAPTVFAKNPADMMALVSLIPPKLPSSRIRHFFAHSYELKKREKRSHVSCTVDYTQNENFIASHFCTKAWVCPNHESLPTYESFGCVSLC